MMRIVLEYVRNLWPFSVFAFDDLKVSDGIVQKLPIPESTKRFIFAIREPDSQAVVYVLAVQNLSERSVLDVQCLVKEIKPDAVVVQVDHFNNLVGSGKGLIENGVSDDVCNLPTSSFEVLKRCFVHKIGRERYEEIAGSVVLREIFGVNFNQHFLAAKEAASKVGSSFFMLESPTLCCSPNEVQVCNFVPEMEVANMKSGVRKLLSLQISNLVPGRMGGSSLFVNSRVFCVRDDIQSQMVKSLSSNLIHANSLPKADDEVIQPVIDYEVPQFAKSVYPLLVDLHDIFVDIPSMKTALACAQKMLCDVNKGEIVDPRLLSDVYAFQIAAEALRIALNNASRVSMSKLRSPIFEKCEFSKLPLEDMSHAILAQALRSQTKKYKSIVAVIDAGELSGLRKHWNTEIPTDVKDMVEELFTDLGDDNKFSDHYRKRFLADNPVVAVGAGATAILGVSSLSKVIPASSLIKLASFHVPTSLQLMFTQTQKAFLFALSKSFGPTKVLAQGMAGSTLKSSGLKAAVSTEKIRMLAHSMIASAEKTSLSAMRSSFYEIMRKRSVRPIGILPWVTLGFSVATCSGLVVYGDGIECAAESFPSAPSVASLGRGIKSLHEVSCFVKRADGARIQKSKESILYKLKNVRI